MRLLRLRDRLRLPKSKTQMRWKPAVRLEELEPRLLLTASLNVNYTSPYAISGLSLLTPQQQQAIGTITGSGIAGTLTATGLIGTAETTTGPTQPNWYVPSAYSDKQSQAYGPEPYVQQSPGVATSPASALTYIQQLLYTEEQFINVPYQHHHDPLFDPFTNGFAVNPNDNTGAAGNGFWPWNTVSSSNPLSQPNAQKNGANWTFELGNYSNPYVSSYGTGTQGIDCSDLTSLAYNVAAGIHLDSSVGVQGLVDPTGTGTYVNTSPIYWNTSGAAIATPDSPTGSVSDITPNYFYLQDGSGNASNLAYTPASGSTVGFNYINHFNSPGSLDALMNELQPGDLLYIASSVGSSNQVSHVVTWLGKYGTMADGSPSPVPLVLSSHDDTPAVLDANNLLAPPGVEILPFDPNSWFYQNFAYAMRVLPAVPSLTMSSISASPNSGLVPGQQTTLTATFNLTNGAGAVTPTGTVVFVAVPITPAPQYVLGAPIVLGSAPLASNLTAQVSTTALTQGNYIITASYKSGSANFADNASWQSLTVDAASNRLYVDQLYVMLFHRVAESGSATWVNQLENGTTATTVVQELETSSEYRSVLVTDIYARYLNRIPDAGGLAGWTQQMADGTTGKEIEAEILGSHEYYLLQGGTDKNFVTIALFANVLHRNANDADTNYWLTALANGAKPKDVALAFFTSSEYQKLLVDSKYRAYLGRPSDASGLDFWTTKLGSSKTDELLLAGILGSTEGFSYFGTE